MPETIHEQTTTFADTVKPQFPLLLRSTKGKTIAYLDSASTTQKPQVVIDAMTRHYQENNANVHRGIYSLAESATAAYERVRARVASFIHCSPEEVIFTSGTTGSINLLAQSLHSRVGKGDQILVSIMEHHSNLVPWQELAKRVGAVVKYIGLCPDGSLDITQLEQLLSSHTKIVSITHVSNVLGTIVDISAVARLVHQHNTLLVVDGAQAVAHLNVDMTSLDCDFYAFSSHKLYGPTGVGILYGRKELLKEMSPSSFGGEMIRTVTTTGSTWNDIPWKFEPGTPNIAGVVGFGAALTYFGSLPRAVLHDHEGALTIRAISLLRTIPGLTIFGPQERAPVISFTIKGIHAHDIAQILSDHNIAVRAGHHCAMPLMEFLAVDATVRVSFGMYTTIEDVDRLIDGIKRAIKVLQ